MTSKLSDFLDSHDAITPEMKELAIQKVINFNTNFKINSDNEAKTIRRLFFAIQENFLKEYVLYSSFFETLDEGKFDCLTGSALYAIFLEEIKQKGNFDYHYHIVQMPTHVFIKIELSDKRKVIFESTNREKGFITTEKGIEFFLEEQAHKAEKETRGKNIVLLDNHKLNNLVTLKSISALLYFNQGVSFFNQRKFGKSLIMAKNAFFYQKNKAFYNLITISLQELLKNNLISENEYISNKKDIVFLD